MALDFVAFNLAFKLYSENQPSDLGGLEVILITVEDCFESIADGPVGYAL